MLESFKEQVKDGFVIATGRSIYRGSVYDNDFGKLGEIAAPGNTVKVVFGISNVILSVYSSSEKFLFGTSDPKFYVAVKELLEMFNDMPRAKNSKRTNSIPRS